MSEITVLLWGVGIIIIGILINYVMFRIWHSGVHSNYLKDEERKRKEKESKESNDTFY